MRFSFALPLCLLSLVGLATCQEACTTSHMFKSTLCSQSNIASSEFCQWCAQRNPQIRCDATPACSAWKSAPGEFSSSCLVSISDWFYFQFDADPDKNVFRHRFTNENPSDFSSATINGLNMVPSAYVSAPANSWRLGTFTGWSHTEQRWLNESSVEFWWSTDLVATGALNIVWPQGTATSASPYFSMYGLACGSDDPLFSYGHFLHQDASVFHTSGFRWYSDSCAAMRASKSVQFGEITAHAPQCFCTPASGRTFVDPEYRFCKT